MFITNVELKLVVVANCACCIVEQIRCAVCDTFKCRVPHHIVRHLYERELEYAVSDFSVRERKERKHVPEVNHGMLCRLKLEVASASVHAFPVEK
jgi:hypothetical protein